MAVTQNTKNNEMWECLSTDIKPTTENGIKNGQKIREIDTSKIFAFDYDGDDWVEIYESKSDEVALGQVGTKAITGTSAVTPATGYYFIMIQVINDIVVSAQGDVSGALNADLTTLTSIPAGTILYGKWDSITLTSGEAIGHYKEV